MERQAKTRAPSRAELAVRFTDTESYFVSEASVYRLLKAHDLIASPAFIVMKAADAHGLFLNAIMQSRRPAAIALQGSNVAGEPRLEAQSDLF
jgi:hypothetical protein